MVEPLSGKRPPNGWSRSFGCPKIGKFASRVWSKVRGIFSEMHNLSAVNFLGMHYGYFLLVSLLASILLWGCHTSTPKGGKLSYVDALFLAVSAQTLTGLNTVDLSTLNTFQQFILFALVMLGSVVWVSIAIIHIRKTIFLRKIRKILAEEESQTPNTSSVHSDSPGATTAIDTGITDVNEEGRNTAVEDASNTTSLKLPRTPKPKYISSQRCAEIGGVEYRALCLLAYIVPAYYVLFQLFGCIGIGWWISAYKPDVPLANGLNPWWMGSFNAISAFNNSGMSLLDKNMVPFQESYYVVLTMVMLILAGNTCFPVFLRLIVWALYKLCPDTTFFTGKRETLKFLLDHPRRCYPYLFQSRDTWWLAAVVVTLNGIDWAAFEILNIGNPTVDRIPLGARIMDGLFQAAAVRSGGFQIVPISEIGIGVQILYVAMMYISVYPIVMTIRNTNDYTDQEVGIYEKGAPSSTSTSSVFDVVDQPHNPVSKRFFLKEQISRQLAHDLWWLALAIWIIAVIETPNFTKDPLSFSVFNIVFEAVSAFGTVGISVGNPDTTFSFCGKWHWASKLVLCAVMLRGRHRGLPVQIDRAIMLPSEEGLRRVVTQGRENRLEIGSVEE